MLLINDQQFFSANVLYQYEIVNKDTISLCVHAPHNQMNTLCAYACLHIDEVESAEGLGQTGDDGSIALRIVIEFKQWSRHQLVVPRYSKIRLLL